MFDRKAYCQAYMKGKRAGLVALGLCFLCGNEPARPSRRTCVACGHNEATRRKRRYHIGRATTHHEEPT